MRTHTTILITLLLTFFSKYSYGQYQQVESQIVFGSRINLPVEIELLNKNDKIVFYAYNKSFYPYQITLNFDFIQNVTPEIVTENYVIYPGKKSFFTLTIVDKEKEPLYRYRYSSAIGDPRLKPVLDYAYLIPLSTYKSFDLFYDNGSSGAKVCLFDNFKVNKGDTVFCMRKGDALATPNMFETTDRISKKKSLEIMHSDGTVLIYENINPASVFVKAGETVYPGEPLGIINDAEPLEILLYSLKGDGTLNSLKINYYVSENRIESFSEKFKNIAIKHPVELITKEMTNGELRKYKKNKLY